CLSTFKFFGIRVNQSKGVRDTHIWDFDFVEGCLHKSHWMSMMLCPSFYDCVFAETHDSYVLGFVTV
ncbi:hypothetical protein KI387_038441, partial [Taxus chinensis]